MGADSAGVSGLSLSVRADVKAFCKGPYVFGFTDSFRMGQLIRYQLDVPAPKEMVSSEFMCTVFIDALRRCLKEGGWAEQDKDRENGGNFLVGVRGRLFEVYSDYQVAEYVAPFAATGCGQDLILGSLHSTSGPGWSPEQRLTTALEAAEHFSAGVCGPFTIISG